MTKKEKEMLGSLLGSSDIAEKKESKPRRPPRSRYWVAEAYKEQIEDFEKFAYSKYVRNSGLRICFILHDKDLKDDGSGEFKKEHLHILFDFGYAISQKTVVDSVGKYVANSYVQLCHSPRSYERYFIHADDPDKAQYLPEKIKCVNGYQFHKDNDASPIVELIGYFYKGNFSNYPQFVRWCYANHPDLVSTLVCCSHNFKLAVGI